MTLLQPQVLINVDLVLIFLSTGSFGSQHPNGTWKGMIGEISRGRADIAIATMSLTFARAQVADFGLSFVQEFWTLATRKPKEGGGPNLSGYFNIFTPHAWIGIGVALSCVILVMVWFEGGKTGFLAVLGSVGTMILQMDCGVKCQRCELISHN